MSLLNRRTFFKRAATLAAGAALAARGMDVAAKEPTPAVMPLKQGEPFAPVGHIHGNGQTSVVRCDDSGSFTAGNLTVAGTTTFTGAVTSSALTTNTGILVGNGNAQVSAIQMVPTMGLSICDYHFSPEAFSAEALSSARQRLLALPGVLRIVSERRTYAHDGSVDVTFHAFIGSRSASGARNTYWQYTPFTDEQVEYLRESHATGPYGTGAYSITGEQPDADGMYRVIIGQGTGP